MDDVGFQKLVEVDLRLLFCVARNRERSWHPWSAWRPHVRYWQNIRYIASSISMLGGKPQPMIASTTQHRKLIGPLGHDIREGNPTSCPWCLSLFPFFCFLLRKHREASGGSGGSCGLQGRHHHVDLQDAWPISLVATALWTTVGRHWTSLRGGAKRDVAEEQGREYHGGYQVFYDK